MTAAETINHIGAGLMRASSQRFQANPIQINQEAAQPTHCPDCGEKLERAYESFGVFLTCPAMGCFFDVAAAAMTAGGN